HHRHSRALESLDAGGADAEPDAADPVRDPGPLAQEGEDAAEIARQRVGHIEEAEIGVRRQRLKLSEAGFDENGPRLIRSVGGAELQRGFDAARAHPWLPAPAPERRRST